MRASIVIKLGDQEVSQEMNLKTMVKTIFWIQGALVLVLVPITAKIQQGLNQVPRSIGCRVS